MYRHNVSNIFQIRTVIHQTQQVGFINNFLACGINQQTVFRHFVYQIIIDRIFCFRSSRNMQRYNITSSIQFFGRCNRLHTVCFNDLFRTISIVCIDVHTKAFGNTSYITSHITVCMNTQFLTFQFSTRTTVIHIADSHHHQPESQFGHSIGVLSRSIHDTYIVSRSSLQIHIVIPCSGTHYNF